MNQSNESAQEKNLLRWGGLSGLLGGSLFIIVMVFVGVVIGDDPSTLSGWPLRFPDIYTARVVENIIYLSALLLGIPMFLSLFWALWRTSLAPALFGAALGIIGLTGMLISATPHVAHAPLAEIYHQSTATAADLSALDLMWQATSGVFNAPLYVGFFVLSLSMLLCGAGMRRSALFGRGWWLSTLVLGLIGFVTAVLQLIDPASFIGAGSYFAFIFFCFITRWNLYGAAKRPPIASLSRQQVTPAH